MVYTERAETAAVSRGTSSVTNKQRCKCAISVDSQKRAVKSYNHLFRITCDKSMVDDINLSYTDLHHVDDVYLPHTDLHHVGDVYLPHIDLDHVGDVNPLTYIMSVTSSTDLHHVGDVNPLTYIMSVTSIL